MCVHSMGLQSVSIFVLTLLFCCRRTSLSKYREAGLADDRYLVTCTLGNLEVAENVIAGN